MLIIIIILYNCCNKKYILKNYTSAKVSNCCKYVTSVVNISRIACDLRVLSLSSAYLSLSSFKACRTKKKKKL